MGKWGYGGIFNRKEKRVEEEVGYSSLGRVILIYVKDMFKRAKFKV